MSMPQEITTEIAKVNMSDYNTSINDLDERASKIRSQLEQARDTMHPRDVRAVERILDTVDGMVPGTVSMSIFLRKQPPKSDYKFTAKADVLARSISKRLAKSKLMFPNPVRLKEAFSLLTALDLSKDDHHELYHRVIFFLDKMNLSLDGPIVATALGRLFEAYEILKRDINIDNASAENRDKVLSARVALRSFLYEARRLDGQI
jgi:hypothetical protein